MIEVKVSDQDGGTITRTAQIVSAGPPGADRTHWARTCDDLPAAWLLVKEVGDSMTGEITYEARQSAAISAGR
jgi:hypothetical protein